MHDDSRKRDARMMQAVAGLGGRSALSGEVDLRLGLLPAVHRGPGLRGVRTWVLRLRKMLGRSRTETRLPDPKSATIR